MKCRIVSIYSFHMNTKNIKLIYLYVESFNFSTAIVRKGFDLSNKNLNDNALNQIQIHYLIRILQRKYKSWLPFYIK